VGRGEGRGCGRGIASGRIEREPSGRSSGQSVSTEVDGVTGGTADVAGVGAWVKVALHARIIRVGRGYPGVGCDNPSKPPQCMMLYRSSYASARLFSSLPPLLPPLPP